jgi:hypothetical protein
VWDLWYQAHKLMGDLSQFGIIIGAMKCGTTSLFNALARHPEVAASGVKELRFFESAETFAKGQAWYLDQFSFDSRRHHIAVEASPTYTMHPEFQGVAERMHQTGWPFRLVYVMRDPIQRIRSHYLQNAAEFVKYPSVFARIGTLSIDYSRYYTQLSYYRAVFDRESILVLSYDDLKADPMAVLGRVCDHFGIRRDDTIKLANVHSSEYHYRRTLLIREMQARGVATEGITLDNVRGLLSTLDDDQRAAIEGSVDARYTLSDEQCEQFRDQLADEMRLLHADYGIDVTRWGFKA